MGVGGGWVGRGWDDGGKRGGKGRYLILYTIKSFLKKKKSKLSKVKTTNKKASRG